MTTINLNNNLTALCSDNLVIGRGRKESKKAEEKTHQKEKINYKALHQYLLFFHRVVEANINGTR
jgi:hypothetical protein